MHVIVGGDLQSAKVWQSGFSIVKYLTFHQLEDKIQIMKFLSIYQSLKPLVKFPKARPLCIF